MSTPVEAVEYDLMDAAEEAMWWYRAMHAQALAAFRAHARGGTAQSLPVLDAGCGTGGFLRRAGAALPGTAMVGLEYNAHAAQRAAQKAGVRVATGSVNAMPYHDAQFGGIFSLDVLCHAGAEPAAMLAECRRVLAPGGVLVMNLPALPWLRSAHDARVFTVRRYTRASITAQLEAAGFTDVRARYWNALLLPLMILQRKVLAARADAPSDVTQFPPWLDACLYAATRLEAGLMRLGLRFPAGGSVIVSATRP